MIIQNLSKTYKNSKVKVEALKDINLSFGEKGLVFITGKSGSGKSTLLNLIGGLLDISNGDIFVAGKSIKEMRDDEIENYRLNYVSFIFQDFCLINELNVYENIALSLKLLDKDDDHIVEETLQKFDIFDLKDKYPNQLSAGQKQRVAIARVLVKESPIILCDEPTGNLDSANSRQILDTLKNVSKDHLVIVVSHNLEDAYYYGDRVIELKDGQVASDLIKDESIKLDDKCIIVHDFNSLSRVELDKLNEKLKDGQIEKIISPKYIFKTNNEKCDETINYISSKPKMSFKNSILLAKRFLRKKSLGMIACSLISSVLFGLLYVAQSFISFDTKNTLSEIYNDALSDTFVLEKGYFDQNDKINKNTMIEVTSDDLEFINENYQGEHYQLYNYSLPCSLTSWNLQNGGKINLNSNFENFFIKETYGVLVTNEDYIKTLFSFNDDIQFAARAENEKDYGIYITDYIADSIIYFRNNIDSYDDLLGQYKNNRDSTYAYINGVINTNYKTKYQTLILEFMNAYSNNDEEKIEKLLKSEQYFNICEEVLVKLGVCFSTNDNFIQAVRDPAARNFVTINNSKLVFNLLDTQYIFGSAWALNSKNFGINLNDFDLSLSLNLFNSIMAQKFSLEEAEEYANFLNTKGPSFVQNDFLSNANEAKFEHSITIKIHNTTFSDCDILMGDELFFLAKTHNFIPYSIYFDNYESAINIIDHMFDIGYFFPSFYSSAIIEIGHLVSIFNNFFILILSILYFGSLSALLIFTYNHIKKNNYNIGVLKSLGASTKDLIKIFTPHIILMGIICFAFFGVFAFSFSYFGNGLITASLIANYKYPALENIQVLNFAPSWFVFDLVAVFTIIALSILVPILLLKKIKPIEIMHKD